MTQHLTKPLYGNCLIIAPDGQPLCRTNQKKLDWYLDRNLAVKVEADCPTIKLRFEPSGRKGTEHPYFLAEKANRCVCCAKVEQITRHHVVPYGFRKFFPLELKEHMLHDVLPMCVDCHEEYELIAFELKKELSKKYNVPMIGKNYHTDKSLYSIRGAASALLKHAQIPEFRREILKNKLRAYYNKNDITLEDIQKAAVVNPMIQTSEFVPFGKHIVDQFDLQEFVVMWRQHFLDNMKPQYMPEFWDVNHKLEH